MTKTQKLKGYIVSKGLTQGEISEKMEINKGTLSRKMNNQTPFTVEEVKNSLKFLNYLVKK